MFLPSGRARGVSPLFLHPAREQKQKQGAYAPRSPGTRPGYVIIAVLLVIVVLSLAAYRFAEAMGSEFQVAVRSTETAQARAFAVSGVHYAAAALADPTTLNDTLGGNPYDNPSAFSNIPVGPDALRGGGRFAVLNVADAGSGSGDSRYTVRYGVEDESGKININALLRLDPGGTVLSEVLLKLPGMPEELVDAIVDWVDSDDDQRTNGAESGSYQAYQPKNGPLNSLDELLLVRGMTADLLYGSDRNRNGRQDPDEPAENGFYRGLADFLTVYGRELNVDSTGAPRTFLNDTDLSKLNQTLVALIGQEMADYVVAYRMYTTGTATANPPAGGMTVVGGAGELRTAVAQSLGGRPSARRSIPNSVMSLYNTQVTLPKPPNSPPDTPTFIVRCPMNSAEAFKQMLPTLLDKTTARSAYELNPRLNVNTAPDGVLTGLTGVAGMTDDDVNNALAIRSSLVPGEPETTTGAWLVTQAGMRPEIFQQLERLVTGTTQTYRVQSIGYFARGGPVARVEAVIDTNGGKPRIVYFRDLTDLGPGFSPPR